MDDTTIILPSARAIRYEQTSLLETTFLPNYITMSDFISKLCIVKDFKYIDDDSRILLLLEASNFSRFSNLQIERNFFTFTKNSSYIFKFFEELSAELYEIENLKEADTYAEYEEHIAILLELYRRYEALCIEKKLLDKIFLPKLYVFNEAYADSHTRVVLHLEGHLTNFEFELLEKLVSFCELEILFATTSFNKKMQSKFLELGIALQEGYMYKISLNQHEVISQEPLKRNRNIHCESFSETPLQVAFVKQKLYEFMQKGAKAEDIAVILPDENAATLLKSFDTKGNFNFAMGDSYTESQIYIKLQATIKAIEQDSKENEARIERVGDALYLQLHSIYYKQSDSVDFIAVFNDIATLFSSKRELEVFREELYSFERVLPFMKEMSLKSVLNLFMQRLAQRSMDDVRGGKVTVMGVLETRGVHFDAVVIINFDDSNVPKRSDKDMFLNTQIREVAKLPTSIDRQNLQKHYYEMLINNSQEVAISYVASSETKTSRFLQQLGIKESSFYDEKELSKILFQQKREKASTQDEKIVRHYDFRSAPLSASKLKTFLSCKRKFYYKHIEHIERHDIPTDMIEQYEIGNIVHTALYDVYSEKESYKDAGELQRDIERALDEKIDKKNEFESYFIALQKAKMKAFSQVEVERFNDGWSVKECEKSLNCEFAGIRLTGQIDRVDARGDELYVIDYKTGKYPIYNKNNFTEATDFQLEFYYLLVSNIAKNVRCAYYDLNENKLVDEPFLEQKLAVLESNIKDILAHDEIDFEKCEDEKNCLYCDYRVMCGRD